MFSHFKRFVYCYAKIANLAIITAVIVIAFFGLNLNKEANAASVLSAGDIYIISVNSDNANPDTANPDNVKFISLSNNLPYIRHLEYGLYSQNSKTGKTVNGFSTQAPNGMFRISVAQFERVFNQQLAARR